jgi:hypothetical protein
MIDLETYLSEIDYNQLGNIFIRNRSIYFNLNIFIAISVKITTSTDFKFI